MNEARIKLAEAMGWEEAAPGEVNTAWRNGEKLRCEPPDPLTDANDDYAVLEWMRKYYEDLIENKTWFNFSAELYYLMHTNITGYQIGDYARAACKVLGIEVLA